ncbi:putative ATP-dependent RNA helicase [Leptomonas pyrrhocoris]|uniref:Probable eukaryotic initiation factor 4A n=1 Tax=Leptomonas pyrrhocoris TaxID=157538 RepID=A0A0N1J4V6_LEPPY|nr:putative ATP-dependent RNA helicase [Leptomonas pyrrhocoris]XP_015659234.1 putative ATP-dependent RNA helicase [Leptomonas pyrrhocoris]XP_015659235.1 putative ATP-dependent RNA helicase [Leptomonas pyrrhocoris]XP_015659236.1 putative ATP-dependent RNA helicase [Leptomonas pyrrhocoris]KPA80794.1 putative ATP-dependent RNA helicase [Leptomonas pyrrhocoris]KPA80795.1 putative ATP-dependent RNA helicase [Leptomonas pyrrhocoris]KPA80796.1 putative ATP-dependent RNA helicase [Leptomonas pyrrhoco|eukprot:XP_015659233.1 putative ATP-dependent RNA helicase [Leptomonas pyrrhocoris]
MAQQFQQLGVQPWLAKQCSYMALHTPTPIQQRCIPAVLAGRHVVGGAATGSGKTAAFALPILQTLAADTYGVYALVLTPSRELAYQIIDQFIAFGAPLQVRTMLAIGGVATETQIDALKARPHIVAATPGRLCHLLRTFGPEVKGAFGHLRYLVLDEADRLTEGDIQRDVWALLRLLPPATKSRQVLLFTATLHTRLTSFAPVAAADASTAEGEVSVLAELGITDPTTLEVFVVREAIQEQGGMTTPGTARAPLDAEATNTHEVGNREAANASTSSSASASVFHLPETLQQHYLFIPNMVKLPYLVAALQAQGKSQSTIVYVNSCLRAELVRLTLQLLGFPVCSLDSLLTQQHRLDNVASFKLGISRILVCTDIAARGLDIPMVGLVLHYDVPKHADTYVHRVGRTARAGREGHSVAFVSEYDVSLVQRIEKKTKTTLGRWRSPAAKETAILPLLDEVSSAKVQAKQQVEEQFGARVRTNKTHAAVKRDARARAQTAAMAQAHERRERREQERHRRGAKQRETHEEEREEGRSKAAASPPPEKPVAAKRVRSPAAPSASKKSKTTATDAEASSSKLAGSATRKKVGKIAPGR